MKFLVIPMATAALLALAGCAKDPLPPQTTAAVTVLDLATLPEPAAGQGQAPLGALDKIRIEVFGVEDLAREVQIDAGGRIAFPFIGSIDVSGQTPDQVARLIEDGLRQGYVKDPDVTVNLVETSSQMVAVEGEVEKPGMYPAAGQLSLLRTLALAGGSTEYALDDQIVIFRDVDGQRYAGIYNLEALRRGVVPDPRIYAHDTVVVGDSPRRRSIDRVLQAAPAFTSPLVLLFTRL